MHTNTKNFEYFNSLYLTKDFEGAAIVISIGIFGNLERFARPQNIIRTDLNELLRELSRFGYTFTRQSFIKIITKLTLKLRNGDSLSILAFLNDSSHNN